VEESISGSPPVTGDAFCTGITRQLTIFSLSIFETTFEKYPCIYRIVNASRIHTWPETPHPRWSGRLHRNKALPGNNPDLPRWVDTCFFPVAGLKGHSATR
jgi:hypothetical protein